jgi:uncharacterized membrane protein YvlD (DUF360 family)
VSAAPAGGEPPGAPAHRWRPTLHDLVDAGASLTVTALALGVAAALVDGLHSTGPLPLLLAALVVAIGDWLARPLLRAVAGPLGAAGALLVGAGAQVLVVWAALSAVPGVSIDSWTAVLATLAIAAVVMVGTRWLLGVNDSAYVLGDLLARARGAARRHGGRDGGAAGQPGVVVVQIDGLAEDVLRLGDQGGTLPTLSRWLRTGSHTLQPWWARVPSTTPASQAGLLHGTSEGVPAFRWWEKDTGRMVVANRPRDAALIESRMSDGRGLLAGGGVSISNLFSGDAATSLMVMSQAVGRQGLGPGPAYVRFAARPFQLARVLVLTLGEMLKELYQGRQQRLRGVEPRVPRHGAYVLLRGVTNVLLRDLNVALVAEHMLRGAPTIFVDLVDYDEIAHHAGPARPESLRALEGVDRVLGLLEQVTVVAPRRYAFVVVSDHGQSQGPTFRQVAGAPLPAVVEGLMRDGTPPDSRPGVAAGGGEDWSRVNALLSEVLGSRRPDGQVVLGPDRRPEQAPEDGAAQPPEVVTIASGNLGAVWFARLPGRVPLEEVQERWPRLVPGLAEHPAVGVVVARSDARGPVAVGRKGVALLDTGEVEGEDPLEPYGPRAAADLRRAAGLDHAGDLVLVSAVGRDTAQVHAFEELVGSHGGLGGAQNRAVLVHPATWPVDEELLDRSVDGEAVLLGAEAVHQQLLRWWRALGLREV